MSTVSTSAKQWTREQMLAQTIDRHISIVAGAGAGKTSVLVERYVKLLLSGSDPHAIVAITFTRKAASEMQSRVVARLNELLQDITYQDEWKKIKQHSERMTGAMITTIHGFCGRILREFPIEAGVNPNYKELEEYDAIRLKERAIRNALDDALSGTSEERDTVLSLARHFTRRTLINHLRTIIDSGEKFEALRTLYTKDNIALLEQLRPAYEDHAHAIERYGKLLSEIPLLKTKQTLNDNQSKALSLLHTYSNQIAEPLHISSQDSAMSEIEHHLEHVHSLIDVLLQEKIISGSGSINGSTLRKDIFAGNETRLEQTKHQLVVLFESFNPLREVFAYRTYDAPLLDRARMLFRIACSARTYYDQFNDEQATLDFDGIIHKALDVLKKSEVQETLRQKYPYIMIDEFQDTNVVQYELARHLVDIYSQSQNLYIVGDPKQSIYRFRGADVSVFEQARNELHQRNQNFFNEKKIPSLPNADSVEQTGLLSLSTTFRLAPTIAAFVNHVCGVLMRKHPDDSRTRFDVHYQDIICGAETDTATQGTIHLLLAQDQVQTTENESIDAQPIPTDTTTESESLKVEESDNTEDSVREARLVAEFIQHIVHTNALPLRERPVVDSNDSIAFPTRPATYKDILILVRSRSKNDTLTQALRRKHIPFQISGGVGFYHQPEIQDLLSCLEFLLNTDDNIACVAMLRSPLFSIQDNEIDRIALSSLRNKSMWQKILHAQEQSVVSEQLQSAIEILKELLLLSTHINCSLLTNFILDMTGWRNAIVRMEREEQMLANMNKLLKIIRGFEHKGLITLHDVVCELQLLQQTVDKESEAPIENDLDAVRIMTIHASKGLESPIVLLFGLNTQPPTASSFLIHEHGGGILFPYTNDNGDEIKTPLYQVSKLNESLAESAEMKRLLYVGMTRAKDHLILSGRIKPNKELSIPQRTMLGLVDRALKAHSGAVDDPLVQECNLFTDLEVPFFAQVKTAEGSTLILDNSYSTVRIYREAEQFVRQETGKNIEKVIAPLEFVHHALVDSVPFIYDRMTVSASQIMKFLHHRDLWIEENVLGLSKEYLGSLSAISALDEEEISDHDSFSETLPHNTTRYDLDNTVAGTLFHAMMENVAEWLNADGSIDSIKFEYYLERHSAIIEKSERARIVGRITHELQDCIATPFLQQNCAALRSADCEVPFYNVIEWNEEKNYIEGMMDCVVRLFDHHIEVWDWKTVEISTTQTLDYWLKHYEVQLIIYLLVLAQQYPQENIFVARLLFSRCADEHEEHWTRTLTLHRKGIPHYSRFITEHITSMKHFMVSGSDHAIRKVA